MQFRCFLYLTTLGTFPLVALASWLPEAEQPAYSFRSSPNAAFIAPNESRPDHLEPIVRNAPAGIYVSVGSERGFIGASLAPRTTHLLLLDSSRTTVFFNRINAALIALGQDLKDYRHLRRNSAFEEWRLRAGANPYLTPSEKASLTRKANFESWRALLDQEGFRRLHDPEPSTAMFDANANFLVNDALYLRLRDLSRAHRIRALRMDLRMEFGEFATLMTNLRKQGLPVAVLDLSNAWYSAYIGPQSCWRLVRAARKNGSNDSIVIAVAHHKYAWAYLGFDFASLANKAYLRALATLAVEVDAPTASDKEVPEAFVNRSSPDLVGWISCADGLGSKSISMTDQGRDLSAKLRKLNFYAASDRQGNLRAADISTTAHRAANTFLTKLK